MGRKATGQSGRRRTKWGVGEASHQGAGRRGQRGRGQRQLYEKKSKKKKSLSEQRGNAIERSSRSCPAQRTCMKKKRQGGGATMELISDGQVNCILDNALYPLLHPKVQAQTESYAGRGSLEKKGGAKKKNASLKDGTCARSAGKRRHSIEGGKKL